MNVLDGELADGMFRAPGRSRCRWRPAMRGRSSSASARSMPSSSSIRRVRTRLAGKYYVVEPLGNETLVTVDVGDALRQCARSRRIFELPVGERCACAPDGAARASVRPRDREAPVQHRSCTCTPPVTDGMRQRRPGRGHERKNAHPRQAMLNRRVWRGRLVRASAAACGTVALDQSRERAAAAAPRQGGGDDHHRQLPGQRDGAVPRHISSSEFQKETGIKVKYNETSYDAWYQNAQERRPEQDRRLRHLCHGRQLGAGVRGRQASSRTSTSLASRSTRTSCPRVSSMGFWPPKSGARMKDFASDQARALRARHHRRRRAPLLQ